MQDFRKLNVWKKAHELTLAVYRATAAFPLRSATVLRFRSVDHCASTPTNLAEGCGRGGGAEFARFCTIAMGSASKLEYQLLLVI
jgi:four helix bundle protein